MGTGINIKCKRCRDYLDYEYGFDEDTQLCDKCFHVVSFDNPEKIDKLRAQKNDFEDYYKNL